MDFMPKNKHARLSIICTLIAALLTGFSATVYAITITDHAAEWVIHTDEVLAKIDDLDTAADYPGAARVVLEDLRGFTADNDTQQANIKALAATRMTTGDIHNAIPAMRSEERSLLLDRIETWRHNVALVRLLLVVLLLFISALVTWLILLMRKQDGIERLHLKELQDGTDEAISGLGQVAPDIEAIRRQLKRNTERIEQMRAAK
jgi:hypothetical protein